MTNLINAITEPRFFMWLITVLFALSAIRQAFAQDWNQAAYAFFAFGLQCAVLNGMKG